MMGLYEYGILTFMSTLPLYKDILVVLIALSLLEAMCVLAVGIKPYKYGILTHISILPLCEAILMV
jgi:hypothetical protein